MNAKLPQRIISILSICLLFTATAFAADGHWGVNANGAWNSSANWFGGVIADGADFTAYLTNPITATRELQITAPQTIGNIVVNDSDGTPNQYQIKDYGDSLTITGANPQIYCDTRLDLVTAAKGSQGFTKLGPGVLNIGLTAKTISGPVNLYQGSEILLNHFQALLNADVNVTGTIVKSRKMYMYAKSLTVGQDGLFDARETDASPNTVPVAFVVKDSITVNDGGQLGAGLSDGIQGQPFALLAPAINVNANGRIIVKNNMTATSIAEPGISGSNITVNSNGEIQFVYNGGTYVINNPLTLAGDGFWAEMGALHTQGNGINLTNNGPITLAGDTRIGQFGVGGYMDIRGNITGTGLLQLWAQAAAADHWKYFDLHGACSYNGALILQTYAASSRTTLHNPSCLQANQVFVMSSVKFSGIPCIVELDLNGHSNTSQYLSAGGDGIKVIRDSSGGNGVLVAHTPSSYCIGVENGGTLRLDSGNVRCPVHTYIRDNSSLVLTGGYFEIGAELLAGHAVTIPNSTGTVTVAGGILSSYVVRNGDVNGVGIINLNGGALRMAAMHTSSAALDGTVNFNGGILSDGSYLDWNSSYANWIQSLTKLYVQAGGAHIEINNSNGRTLLNGLLHDAALGGTPDGGLVKLGTGPLTLSGNNTYTGPTIVSNGTLRINGSIAASSGVSVHGGAVGGTGTLAVTTIAAAGILAPGNSVGTLTVNGLTLQSNVTNEWEKGAGVDSTDETVINGDLTINDPVVVRVLPLAGATPDGATNPVFTVSGTLTGFSNLQLDLNAAPGWSGNLVQDGSNVGVVLVPEPALCGLLALALFGLLRKVR